MKKNRKSVIGLVAGAALAVGLIGVGATPADAASGCYVSGQGGSRSAICAGGGGSWRIAIFCVNWGGYQGNTVYGPWMSGKPSAAWCEWYQNVGSAWVQTR